MTHKSDCHEIYIFGLNLSRRLIICMSHEFPPTQKQVINEKPSKVTVKLLKYFTPVYSEVAKTNYDSL